MKDRQLSQAQQSSVTSGAGSGEHLPRNTKCPNETMGPVGGETKKKTMSSWEDIHASCTSAEQGNMVSLLSGSVARSYLERMNTGYLCKC